MLFLQKSDFDHTKHTQLSFALELRWGIDYSDVN
jgi:hypothetical protein